jgi:hypothetical protein
MYLNFRNDLFGADVTKMSSINSNWQVFTLNLLAGSLVQIQLFDAVTQLAQSQAQIACCR